MTKDFRSVNPNSRHKACPHEPNIFIHEEHTSKFVYGLAEFLKIGKQYRRYNFTNVGVTTIITCVKYEVNAYQKFTTNNSQNAGCQLPEFACNKGPF
jgi:hypothetical protein